MGGSKPLTGLSASEVWSPNLFGEYGLHCMVLMNSLDAVLPLGIAYGLLGTLIAEILTLIHDTPSRAITLHVSEYFPRASCVSSWISLQAVDLALADSRCPLAERLLDRLRRRTPLHWLLVLSRQGFKSTFMTGLAIYGCRAMSFWPSSVLKSYAGFFISNFIIALGLSCLEVAANPLSPWRTRGI